MGASASRVAAQKKALFGDQQEKTGGPVLQEIGKFFGQMSNKLTSATGALAKGGASDLGRVFGGGKPPVSQSANLALDASSAEGFKALRANLGRSAQDPQKKIADISKKQLDEDKIANGFLGTMTLSLIHI